MRMIVASLLLFHFAGCARRAETRLTTISDSLAPLRAEFNAQAGQPRIIGVFSPT